MRGRGARAAERRAPHPAKRLNAFHDQASWRAQGSVPWRLILLMTNSLAPAKKSRDFTAVSAFSSAANTSSSVGASAAISSPLNLASYKGRLVVFSSFFSADIVSWWDLPAGCADCLPPSSILCDPRDLLHPKLGVVQLGVVATLIRRSASSSFSSGTSEASAWVLDISPPGLFAPVQSSGVDAAVEARQRLQEVAPIGGDSDLLVDGILGMPPCSSSSVTQPASMRFGAEIVCARARACLRRRHPPPAPRERLLLDPGYQSEPWGRALGAADSSFALPGLRSSRQVWFRGSADARGSGLLHG